MLSGLGDAASAGGCCPQLRGHTGGSPKGGRGQDPHPHTNSDTRKKFGPGARARRGIARPWAAGRGGLENTSSFRSSTQAFKILSLFYFKKYRAGAPREVQTGGWRGHGAGPRGMAPGTESRPGDTRGHPPTPPPRPLVPTQRQERHIPSRVCLIYLLLFYYFLRL